jgi:major outer membrane protein
MLHRLPFIVVTGLLLFGGESRAADEVKLDVPEQPKNEPRDWPLLQPSPTFVEVVSPPRRLLRNPPGLYADVELSFVFADVFSRLQGEDAFSGRRTNFDLDVNVAPTFTLGYTFANDLGSVLTSYRYLGTDGRPEVSPGFPGDSRLDLNDVSLLYRRAFEIGSGRCYGAIDVGGRLMTIFYDLSSTIDFPTTQFSQGGFFDFHASNYFVGAGPSVGYTGEWELVPGLSVFGHSDFAALFGRNTFKTAFSGDFGTGGAPAFQVADQTRRDITVKALRAEAGLNWAPCSTPHMMFQFGYTFEYLWDVGRFEDIRDDLMLNGIFARMRINY